VIFLLPDCEVGNYLVDAKVRERLSISKRTEQEFGMETFNLKKLKMLKSKNSIRIKNSENVEKFK
jgi:hypothetical protein